MPVRYNRHNGGFLSFMHLMRVLFLLPHKLPVHLHPELRWHDAFCFDHLRTCACHLFHPVAHPFAISPAIRTRITGSFCRIRCRGFLYKRLHTGFFQLLCPMDGQPSANAFTSAISAAPAFSTGMIFASAPAAVTPSATL